MSNNFEDSNHTKEKELTKMRNKIHAGEISDVGNTKDITSLQEWQIRQNGTLNEIKNQLKELTKKINDLQSEDIANLRIELAKGRPSWTVTILITFLSSIAVGAIVYVLRSSTPIF